MVLCVLENQELFYMAEIRKSISLKGIKQFQLLGPQDSYIKLVEDSFNAKIVIRNDEIRLMGEPEEIESLERLFTELIFLLNRNEKLETSDVQTTIDVIRSGDVSLCEHGDSDDSNVIFYGRKYIIHPKTKGQEAYYQSVLENDIVFVTGPAGTGKTFLAVAFALSLLQQKEISKIILTRPAIEAGENLGFLPGDLMDKVDPYLRPLTDAVFDMLPAEKFQKYVERKIIEIVPLAYMRGRTLNDAVVILDEAQNTSTMQMKMFLTRLGIHSKAIITGDVTQIDLPANVKSGMVQVKSILKDVDGIGFVTLGKRDVVRHKLVKKIIEAYEIYNNEINETIQIKQ